MSKYMNVVHVTGIQIIHESAEPCTNYPKLLSLSG